MWDGRPRDEERAVDVGLDGPVELLGGDVREIRAVILTRIVESQCERYHFLTSRTVAYHDTGVVHEDINLAERLDERVDHGFATGLFTDVLRDEEGASAVLDNEELGLLRVLLLLGKVDDPDLRKGKVLISCSVR